MKALIILAIATLLSGCFLTGPDVRIQRDTFGNLNVWGTP